MKKAYMEASQKGLLPDDIAKDPYDLVMPRLLGPHVEPAGKVMLEGHLTSRPDISFYDLVRQEVLEILLIKMVPWKSQ